VYFNNHFAGFAPDSINLFRRVLGLSEVPYAPTEAPVPRAGATPAARRARRKRLEEYGGTPS
jgi:hypothetical protein